MNAKERFEWTVYVPMPDCPLEGADEEFTIVAEKENGEWIFEEKSVWDIKWRRIKPNLELLAKLDESLQMAAHVRKPKIATTDTLASVESNRRQKPLFAERCERGASLPTGRQLLNALCRRKLPDPPARRIQEEQETSSATQAETSTSEAEAGSSEPDR